MMGSQGIFFMLLVCVCIWSLVCCPCLLDLADMCALYFVPKGVSVLEEKMGCLGNVLVVVEEFL